jgi:hypothetical protein
VRTQPASEQPVAIRNVDDVSRSAAGRENRARHQPGPDIDIRSGVADDGRFAGRAAGSMQSHQLLARHGEQSEWILSAEVLLHQKRKAT